MHRSGRNSDRERPRPFKGWCRSARHTDKDCGLQAVLAKRNPLTDARDLHRWLLQNRLADDPTVHQVEAYLGDCYMRVRRLYRSARENLEDWRAHFSNTYPQTPAATVVQVLALLAEVNQADGMWLPPTNNWSRAARALSTRPDRRTEACGSGYRFISGRLERLHAALRAGQGRSFWMFCGARRGPWARQGAESANLARLSLAMLYKGFGQLEEAEKQCRQALESHCRVAGARIAEIVVLPPRVGRYPYSSRSTRRGRPGADPRRQLAGAPARDADETREQSEVCHLAAMLDLMRYGVGRRQVSGREGSPGVVGIERFATAGPFNGRTGANVLLPLPAGIAPLAT